MANVWAAVALVTGLYLLGHAQVRTTIAGQAYSCSVLMIVAFIVGAIVLACVLYLARAAFRLLFEATA